jgi:hypothetical protein
MENDPGIFPAHYTWKVAEKGFKMACMMNKLPMINSCEIILEKNFFFDKNYYEIQVHTILVCALYSIKYGKCYSYFTDVTSMKLLLFPSFQFYFVYLSSGAQHMH